jgi:hypothetical protein
MLALNCWAADCQQDEASAEGPSHAGEEDAHRWLGP